MITRFFAFFSVFLGLAGGGGGGSETMGAAGESEQCQPTPDYSQYAMDHMLRLNELQALGTHNSYHLESDGNVIPDWHYSHAPLNVQLQRGGVRQLEMDIHYDEENGMFSVFHLPILDEGSSCGKFTDCLRLVKCWSDAHPTHHPVMLMIEPKFSPSQETAPKWIRTLENEVLTVWPEHRLMTPDMVQGNARDLRTAVERYGWPKLGELRGRVFFMLHADNGLRAAYTFGDQHTTGRVMFPNAKEQQFLPYAAMHSFDDPTEDGALIEAAVLAGHVVRTRTDSMASEAANNAYSQYDAAIESGAHFLSTDYPGRPTPTNYAVEIPGGTPSRCNPLVAPLNCRPEQIEDLPDH